MIRQSTINTYREIIHATRTTAFRFSLLFTLVASVITGASMAMIYQTARQEISNQIDSRLFSEMLRLRRIYEYRNALHLYTPSIDITEQVQVDPAMSYCLTRQSGEEDLFSGREKRNIILLNVNNFSDLCSLYRQLVESRHEKFTVDAPVASDDSQMMRAIITPMPKKYVLVVGYDTRNKGRILRRMINMAWLVTAILIFASFFGSFFISRTITNSTKRIGRTARRIVDGDFSERIFVKKTDSNELRGLAGDLNHMLDRIQTLISSQRQVTNNIAHDLRSPLNRLRSRMEVALLDDRRSNEELREVIAESIEDTQKILQTFNALLNIAQVEARARDDFEEISITRITEDLAEMYDVLSEEGLHTFRKHIESHLTIMGNRQLIAQAITNLLDNAVKYTPHGGCIELRAYHKENHIVIAVSDNGEGIPENERKHVLRRFVRLDSARSTPGNGLGLSLVNAVVTLHNGMINLEDNAPGLRIELLLPDLQTFRARWEKDRRNKARPKNKA